MSPSLSLEDLLELLVERIADRVGARLASSGRPGVKQRLLTIEDAGGYIGRTVEAMRHLVNSGKVAVVRVDKRIFIDIRDLDELIERSKQKP
jgi:hypothetical protein